MYILPFYSRRVKESLNFSSKEEDRCYPARIAPVLLLKELAGIYWDVLWLSEVIRTGGGYTVLKGRHMLCNHGLANKSELGVGLS